MTDERWQEVISQIKDNFKVLAERQEDLAKEPGGGTVEVIEFIGPLGKMKLERTTQPKILDKKTIGSRRIGSDTKVEYIYSDTELVHRFKAFKWNETDNIWVEVEREYNSNIF